MKIWRNNKRVVKSSRFTRCKDCCLSYILPDRSLAICLAKYFKIQSEFKLYSKGYKYETDV